MKFLNTKTRYTIKTIKNISIITLLYISLIGSSSYAQRVNQARNFPGIDIIERSERGADESIRLRKEGRGGLYNVSQKIKTAEQFVLQNYPKDFVIESSIEKKDDKYLTRPVEYNNNKKAIVIHHTASSRDNIEKKGVKEHMKDIYKFHTLTRNRGDIGYQFLIDHDGNVYEGRYGGQGVIGAHARRNNATTLGISLIGDYNERKPSNKQWQSLAMLILQLSILYDIDPYEKVSYHEAADEHPYIEQHHLDSIIGHKDTTNTTCPGEHIYNRLPQLKTDITKLRLMRQNEYRIKTVKNISNTIQIPTSQTKGQQTTISLPYEGDTVAYCEFIDNKNLEIISCKEENNKITINIKKTTSPIHGQQTMRIHDKYGFDSIYNLRMQREEDLIQLTKKRADGLQSSRQQTTSYPKIISPITTSQAKEMLENNITVKLEELSENFLSRDIKCNGCTGIITPITGSGEQEISRGDETLHIEIFSEDILSVTTPSGQGRFTSSLDISSNNGQLISFENYKRTSFAGIARNSFYKNIKIYKEKNGKQQIHHN